MVNNVNESELSQIILFCFLILGGEELGWPCSSKGEIVTEKFRNTDLTGGDLYGWVQLTTSPGKESYNYLWTATPSLHLFTILLFCFQRVQQISTQTRPPRLDHSD